MSFLFRMNWVMKPRGSNTESMVDIIPLCVEVLFLTTISVNLKQSEVMFQNIQVLLSCLCLCWAPWFLGCHIQWFLPLLRHWKETCGAQDFFLSIGPGPCAPAWSLPPSWEEISTHRQRRHFPKWLGRLLDNLLTSHLLAVGVQS